MPDRLASQVPQDITSPRQPRPNMQVRGMKLWFAHGSSTIPPQCDPSRILLPDTEEVTGSSLVSPTTRTPYGVRGSRHFSGGACHDKCHWTLPRQPTPAPPL